MTDSSNQGINKVEAVNFGSGLPLDSELSAQQLETVKLGYSGKLSSEQVGQSVVPFDVIDLPVPLDAPVAQAVVVQETVESSTVNAQLKGLKEVVAYFNKTFDLDALDMADTASVLLMIKGMVSDMRALSGAENVDSALRELQTQFQSQIALARDLVTHSDNLKTAKDNKTQAESDKVTKEAELTGRQSDLAGKQAERDAILAEDPPGDTSVVDAEIAVIEADIMTLTDDITQLENDIATYTGEITALSATISEGTYRLSTEISSSLERTFSITEKTRQRYDASATRTWEKERAKTEVLNKEEAVVHEAAGKEQGKAKQAMVEEGKLFVGEQVKEQGNAENRQRQAEGQSVDVPLPVGLQALLEPADDVQDEVADEIQPLSVPTPRPVKEELQAVARLFETILSGVENDRVLSDVNDARGVQALNKVNADVAVEGSEVKAMPVREEKPEAPPTSSEVDAAKEAERQRIRMEVLNLEAHVWGMVLQAVKDQKAIEGTISKTSRA